MKTIYLLLFCITTAVTVASAPKKYDSTYVKITREIAELRRMKADKLSQLETAETDRWNQRYRHNQEMKLLESQSRQFETRYSSFVGQLNRRQEDIMLLKGSLDEEKEKKEAVKDRSTRFTLQIRQAVEEYTTRTENDFPYAVAERTAQLSSITAALEKTPAQIGPLLTSFIGLKLDRVAQTSQQKITTRAVLFGDGKERTAWNIRCGTVLMIDIDKDSTAYQLLMHTGSIQGQRYRWKNSVSATFYQEALQLLTALQEHRPALLPLDVLQNGKIGSSDDRFESKTVTARFKRWFSQGGLIMYPLFICAFLALLLSLERFFTLTARYHQYRRSYKLLIPLIKKGDWDNATHYCKKRCTGLTRAINEIVHRRNGSRLQAEQHVQQILLGEVPALEKRMSIISALGASAPLLGLLGTVSGMITLFKVITETGTNDARILAGGISEALVTTQTGLLVAIPILLFHGYLSERLENILSHYNETVLEVFNVIFNGSTNGDSRNDS